MDLYGQLVHHVLFPAWEKVVRRRPTLDHLGSLMQTQWLSADELRALQGRALRALVQRLFGRLGRLGRSRRGGLRPRGSTADDRSRR